MNIQLKKSNIINTFYHLLSHLDINHPSSIYDESYVNDYKLYKKKHNQNYQQLMSFMKRKDEYLSNFNELAILNFVPFHSSSFEETFEMLENYSTDMTFESKVFIEEFINLVRSEKNDFLRWGREASCECISKLKSILLDNKNPLRLLRQVLNFEIDIYLIGSLFQFGRAVVIDSRFIAGVLEPRNDKEVNHAVLITLHEMIHCITDNLVVDTYCETEVVPLKERLVMYFEYLYIKTFYSDWLDSYMDMLDDWCPGINEDNILDVLKIETNYLDSSQVLIEEMRIETNQN